ncbi:MAG: ribosome recycling factor [Akkermansia sp.]|nr:ribosome recycling factor [Akkermansia sp.]
MDEETLLLETETAMEEAVERLNTDCAGVRTGKASPSLVDNMDVYVASYGSSMKLKGLAVISTPDARSILIQPFDPGTLNDIKKAIADSKLGITPVIDARSVRLPIPELTGERRKEMCKYVDGLKEDARVRVRAARKAGMDGIKKLKADNILTEDGVRQAEDKVQKLTDKYTKKIDEIVEAKEKEIMTV